jgi:hypothetical protein
MIHRPVISGLIVCERVIIEERTRNLTLVNCFTHLHVNEFPSVPERFTVFTACTDALGEMTLDLVINRLDTFEEIYVQSHRVEFRDRLQEIRFLFRVNKCSFPTAGEYLVSIMAEGESAGQRKLRVSRRED